MIHNSPEEEWWDGRCGAVFAGGTARTVRLCLAPQPLRALSPSCDVSLFRSLSSTSLPFCWVVTVPRDFPSHGISLHHPNPNGTRQPVLCQENHYQSQLSRILQGKMLGPGPEMG